MPSNRDLLADYWLSGATTKRNTDGTTLRSSSNGPSWGSAEMEQNNLIVKLQGMSNAERILDVERLAEGFQIKGDFDGCVTGQWVRKDSTGAGVVSYRDKEYITQTMGFVSAPAGLMVQLCYAAGKYFSTF